MTILNLGENLGGGTNIQPKITGCTKTYYGEGIDCCQQLAIQNTMVRKLLQETKHDK